MNRLGDYSDDEIYQVLREIPFSLSEAARRLKVSPEELGRWLAARTLQRRVGYAYDEETWRALTCPHCGSTGPPVFIDDPREYLLPAYGGIMDSKSLVALALEGECASCQIEYHEASDTWVPVDFILTGSIGYQDWNRPLIIIDGRELPWEEFGRLVLTHEGWNFRLQFIDPSEA